MAPYNFPSSPAVGDSFADYVWDGVKWVKTAQGDATISTTPPPDPRQGQLWWNSDTGILYIWYHDGTSGQWVQAVT
jgi:hypothetical protein